MKKTDLAKQMGLKLTDKVAIAGAPSRFGTQAVLPNRREQRKVDQALGLVPFAVKIHSDLVTRIQARAAERGTGVNELVAELLASGLETPDRNA